MDLALIFTRTLSIAFIPFALFMITHTARRSSVFERYAWGTMALSLVALCWLTNGFLVKNTRLLLFMYPQYIGFLFLLGPAYFFAITGYTLRNISVGVIHVSAAVLLFAAGIYGNFISPSTESDYIAVFEGIIKISEVPWSFLGDQFILLVILPFHFVGYAIAAYFRTNELAHLLFLTPIATLLISFTLLFTVPIDMRSENVYFIFSWISEIALFIIAIRYLITDTAKHQYKRKSRLNIEIDDYESISNFLKQQEVCDALFTKKVFPLDYLARESDIDKATWRNYLADEQMSFTDLKKQMKIDLAIRLIEDGFLDHYTVDALANKIGYSSRTSFYATYKEITGNPWSRF